ncbi:DUF1569 domain-containing protein [Nonlabens ponticola]|uniref:DUF1569 domain-containing protein n=1 Tax=Nonlabens ponticola TaxID=2496866 RepID=A0A3S9MWR3_9FLAO|nr:DUF1569 domain-containing protein [Nonlabens ponticola]AZQ43638.1 DUF1569 domain-containing protein [Nonlabens ponticola]
MKSFFEQQTYEELRARLQQIESSAQPEWGKMNAAQMFQHCQYPIQTALGKDKFNMKPNWIVKLLFKKMMYSEKPFKRNAPTPKVFQATDNYDFSSEKEKLDQWMQELWYDRDNEDRRPHPVFGHFTKDQWGTLQWKHLDHHFRQFGV